MASHYSALYRYSQWDGRYRQKSSPEDLMGGLSDDFLLSGDIDQALRSLMRRGMNLGDNQRMSGLHDMIRKLREQRRQQLQRYNLDSVFDDLKKQLEEIIDLEQGTINRWLTDGKDSGTGDAAASQKVGDPGSGDGGASDVSSESAPGEASSSGDTGADSNGGKGKEGGNNTSFADNMLKDIAARNRQKLEQLPEDVSGQMKSLQDYEFLNPEAQEKFQQLLQQMRDALTQTFFKDISEMVNNMSDGDMSRMKDMLKALNEMLVKHIAGDDPGFEDFMQQYGDMFGENPPGSIEELLAQMQAQMAAAQSLMNSLSPEQRSQLESLFENKFGDPELQNELMKLGKEMAFLDPQGGQYRFSGEEDIDLQSALKLMDELQKLESLEKQFQNVGDFSDLDKIDENMVKELLGEEGVEDLDELKSLLDTLQKAGYIRQNGERWDMTPRGSRVIGQKALEEIYRKLKHANLGNHRSIKEGRFGDQQEDSKAYEYGDPLNLHIPRTLKNAIRREYADTGVSHEGGRLRLQADDFEIHRQELNTKTSTVLLLDLSWSMALRDAFLPAKKVALALHHLITSSFPRDTLDIIGFSAYAREIKASELLTIDVDQFSMGTNMHHALMLAEKKLSKEHAGTKQVIMISDGEPTAHLEEGQPYFEYPPNPVTIAKTLLAVKRCTQKQITINTFMLDRSPFLRSFMNKIAQMNGGRVFYTSANRLGEYILHDYVANKRKRVA